MYNKPLTRGHPLYNGHFLLVPCTPFTLHVGTGPNQIVPHFMIKVLIQPNHARSGPPMFGVPRWCSCRSVQLRSYCQRFATRPARFSSVLVRSVNAVLERFHCTCTCSLFWSSINAFTLCFTGLVCHIV